MKKSLAVPVETTTRRVKAWSARMQDIAVFGAQQCRSRDSVHSAICTITGSAEALVVNLACTAKSEVQVSELMQYVDEALLPQMEKALGVQFEVRNLQFAVAGRGSLLASPEHIDGVELPKHWLDHPFAAPVLPPAPGMVIEASKPRTDLHIV
ncbi:hypothetical protein [Glutamicibacter sp.]|uniref:hypothetical protein n=1 Tax=Glutamicibacter sp. TaxID=1931995 RepID=UPI002B4742F9|nr:hypothetical protein [Glutamicibacter sp.]HJX78147.1 hypothetical protein [Glutamicibacter sp.]